MLMKIIAMNIVIAGLAYANAACSSLPETAGLTQPLADLVATPTPVAIQTPEAFTAPQASRNPNPNGNNPNAVAPPLKLLGLEGGIVAKTSSTTLTLRAGKNTGQVQIQIGTATLIVVPGKVNATIADVKVGDRVLIRIPQGDPNAVAQLVVDLPSSYRQENMMLGVVQSNSSGSITLKAKRGTETLTTDTTTLVIKLSDAQPVFGSVSDLRTGSGVIVIGDSTTASFNAQAIFVLPQGGKGLGKDKKNAPQPKPTPSGA